MRLLTSLFLLGMLLVTQCGAARVRVFELHHVCGEQVRPMVCSLLGENGKAEVVNGRLVVDGPEDALEDIAQLLRRVDVPPRLLQVSVSLEKGLFGSMDSDEYPGTVARRLGNASSLHEYRISVLEGAEGVIRLAEKLPFVEEFAVVHGRRQGYRQRIGSVETVNGVRVRPRLVGGQAVLELRPWFGEARPAENIVMQAPKTETLQAATVVRVALGEWVDLGGRLGKALFANGGHSGKALGNVSRTSRLWVKVEFVEIER